jgi:hypothetical protein
MHDHVFGSWILEERGDRRQLQYQPLPWPQCLATTPNITSNTPGTSADVNWSAAYNPETANWEKSGSGTAYNPNTGASAQVQHTSEGYAYHSTTSGETTATVTNREGQTNTYAAGHAGNNIYAGSDGNGCLIQLFES